MSSNRLILENLFEIYSKSLNLIDPKIGESFVCPICLNKFSRNAIDRRSLSLEHVPPKCIGHSIVTMTCTECNNSVGNHLQNQMKNYVRKKELWGGRKGNPIPAVAYIDGNRWSFILTGITKEGHVEGFSSQSHVSPHFGYAIWRS